MEEAYPVLALWTRAGNCLSDLSRIYHRTSCSKPQEKMAKVIGHRNKASVCVIFICFSNFYQFFEVSQHRVC